MFSQNDTGNKILFMGLSQSGKTSIIQVVFEGIMPKETIDNPATVHVRKRRVQVLGNIISVVEVGGQFSYIEQSFAHYKESIYSNLKALIFVVDSSAPNLFGMAKRYYEKAYTSALEFNENPQIHVFAHKMDLIEENQRSKIVDTITNLFEIETMFIAKIFPTSIYEEPIFKIMENFIAS
ncbi:MAG: ADP-ribosylation factor-like protein [Candidatus Heimdallarchaeaceae archaeon]